MYYVHYDSEFDEYLVIDSSDGLAVRAFPYEEDAQEYVNNNSIYITTND